MSRYAVMLEHTDSWDQSRGLREQDAWDEHAAFMDALVDEGFVVLGGPLGDRRRVLLVVEAEDQNAIEPRLAADPWWEMGMLGLVEIQPWEILLKARA